tara:strand:+ start:169 stop:705 length:537 start_codon:yes stop_codon:yes gene_type:complete
MSGNYSMDDEAWNKRKSKVMTFLESNDIGEMEQVITWNINTGDVDADNRKRYWTSITTLFGMLDNSPITRGRESTLPDDINQIVLNLKAEARQAYIDLYNSGNMSSLIEKHGKSGGGLYEDAETMADKESKTVQNRLTRYYRNHVAGKTDEHTWDGSLDDNGAPQVNYITATEAEEEE